MNCWTGEVVDLDTRVVPKTAFAGNVPHGNGIVDVALHPDAEDAERCVLDVVKVANAIRKPAYEQEILRSAHGLSRLSYAKIDEALKKIGKKQGSIPANNGKMKCSDIKQFTSNGSYSVDFGMKGLVKAMEDYERMGLNVYPDFQREHVWTKEQQSAFVEYFLRGGGAGQPST